MIEAMSLDQIGLEAGTDKNSNGHDFLSFYEESLEKFKGRKFTLFEIGVYQGKSLLTWGKYFPDADIIGIDIDINTEKHNYLHNTTIVIGDASKLEVLDDVIERYGRPLIVVEDGSHQWHHQIETLRYLWPRIQSGGLFIMEDIHTSFPDAEVEYRGASDVSCYDYLLRLNRWVVGNRYMSKEVPDDGFIANYWPTVRSMHFYRGTCIIHKR